MGHPTVQVSDIEQTIHDFLPSDLDLATRANRLSFDQSLIAGGLVDSLAVLGVVEFLESRFEVRLDPGREYRTRCSVITYIPMASDFSCLVAIMDLLSRFVLARRPSNGLDADLCIENPQQALARHNPPHIFSTDQGSQFTSATFTEMVENHGVAIGMDGRGRGMDTVFVKRL